MSRVYRRLGGRYNGPLITACKCAQLLGMTPNCFYNYLKADEIPPPTVRLNNIMRWHRDVIIDFSRGHIAKNAKGEWTRRVSPLIPTAGGDQ